MDDQNVEWVKGRNGRIIVTLPDGSEITVHDLVEKLGIGKQSASVRIRKYIQDGNLKNLLKPKDCRVVYKKPKKKVKHKKLRYQEGDIKQAYCYWFHLALTGKQNKTKHA